MDRLDKAIADLAYIADCLSAYKAIIESGCCNNCEQIGDCKCRPDWGEQTRYNCPFYKPLGG